MEEEPKEIVGDVFCQGCKSFVGKLYRVARSVYRCLECSKECHDA